MRKIYCDCCTREIQDLECVFTLKINKGQDSEIELDDLCDDCYKSIKRVIDNAQMWKLMK